MISTRAPIIAEGQLYLHEELNEYIIITKNTRGQVQYAGVGFQGFSEDNSFIERFQPVDPADVDPEEIKTLLKFCRAGVRASTGFISED